MTQEQYNKYLEAVDIVCMDCYFSDKPIICGYCPVRKTCNYLKRKMKNEAMTK